MIGELSGEGSVSVDVDVALAVAGAVGFVFFVAIIQTR